MQNGGFSIGSSKLDSLKAFVTNSNDALRFRLVRNEKDLDAESDYGGEFAPEMSHQVFGDTESIFGYRNLRVDLYMEAASLKAFVRMSADETINEDKNEGIVADPVIPPLLDILAPGQVIIDNESEFRNHLESDAAVKFLPFGEKLTEFKVDKFSQDGTAKTYEIYLADESVPGFIEFHSRLQPWIMFYIDAASFIVVDDNWKFFVVYEKYLDEEGRTRYAVVGYCTVYQYFAYPENIRPKVSQMLIFPQFQRQGIGAKLLRTIYQHYWTNKKVKDIAVEDPSEDFVKLRDYVDVKLALEMIPTLGNPKELKCFTDELSKEMNTKMKLYHRQARRVYEIIRLHWTKKVCPLKDSFGNTEYRKFKAEITKRIEAKYRKEMRELERLKKFLKPEELVAAQMAVGNLESRQAACELQYNQIEEEYLSVLESIAAS